MSAPMHAAGDPVLDRAIDSYPSLEAFLQQGMNENISMAESIDALVNLTNQATGNNA